jgi:multidrug efflux pump subunit AcrA (membrane-fusion protein)
LTRETEAERQASRDAALGHSEVVAKPRSDVDKATAVALPATLPVPVPVPKRRRWRRIALVVVAIGLAAGGGGYYWWKQSQDVLPPGIVASNGRIEADQIDIDTKFAGRLIELLATEGDMVRAGQVVARMDTRDLEASLKQARAQELQAQRAIDEARAMQEQQQTQVRSCSINDASSSTAPPPPCMPPRRASCRRSTPSLRPGIRSSS